MKTDALLEQAIALHKAKNLVEAEALYKTVLEADPTCAAALMPLGIIDVQRGLLNEGVRRMEEVIAIDRLSVDAYYNHGFILQMLGRHEEALISYDKAIAIDPGYVGAQYHKALLLLTLGRFEQGWPQYEWRWKAKPQNVRSFTQPLWRGEEPIAGKRIFVYAEQGFGDTIQFCRYVPMLEALGAHVIFEVRPPLMQLMATLKGNYQLVAQGTTLPAFDLQCPLLSLPGAFKTNASNIPADIPYLSADPLKQQRWAERLGPKTKNRVGLVWSGSFTNSNDHTRSIAPELFASLWKFDFEYHLLQKDLRPHEAHYIAAHPHIISHTQELGDFADTAALISQMDLVISVDTAVAHLAGALGKPVWILVSFLPDFRWLLDREDSPWYPTARVLRQPRRGDWASVIAKLAI